MSRKICTKKTAFASICVAAFVVCYLYQTEPAISPVSDFSNRLGYAIDTPGCRIPEINPFSKESSRILKPENITCTTAPNLVTMKGSILQINREVLHPAHTGRVLSCCQEKIVRVTQDPTSYDKEADSEYRTEGGCIEFTSGARVAGDYVRIRCNINGTKVYTNLFAYPQVSNKVSLKMMNGLKRVQRPFSVLVIGLDSVSRAGARRILPQALDYLNGKGAIEFKGYTKVGENTLPNFSPLLTGFSLDQLKEVCWPKQFARFDNCPFVWKEFSNRDFITAYGEDETQIGTFNYQKTGFVEQPTDFYLRPLMKAAEKELNIEYAHSLIACLGERFTVNIINQYTLDFASEFRENPYFAFFWTNSLTHNDANTAFAAGEPYYKLLRELFEGEGMSGAMDNTILIFFSDHGIRFGKIRQTKSGLMEESLPMLFWWFPPRFHQQHPQAVESMHQNAEKLTSPFDMYPTLRAILNQEFSISDGPKIAANKTHYPAGIPERPKHGRSLFQSIPPNRTCEEAGIPEEWCMCRDFVKTDPSREEVLKVANFTLRHINSLFAKEKQCVTLQLIRVVAADVYGPVVFNGVKNTWLYRVTFQVSPSDALFQSECAYTPKKLKLIGDVSRTNAYHNQSECVTDMGLKMYCFCRS